MTKRTHISTVARVSLLVTTVVLTAVLLVSGLPLSLWAQNAQELVNESSEIRQELEETVEETLRLQEQAMSLEEAIEELDEEIEEQNKEIKRLNRVIDALQERLDEAQAELSAKAALLRANMRTLYKRGDVSTFELMASSDSFSEFIDEQEYLERLKDQIQGMTREIYDIQQSIRQQQNEQRELLVQQESVKESLAEMRAEREELLDETLSEEERLREHSQSLVARQQEINRELIRMSQIVTTEGTGGYPWADALCVYTDAPVGPCRHPTDSWGDFEGYVDDKNNRRDEWEFFYRNCTSYVAWRSAQDGFEITAPAPGRSGLGDAGSWHKNASRYDELSVGTEPRVGSFAVFANGPFGHVAYVERISGDRVLISEYNLIADGMYSERWIPRYQPTAYVYTPYSR